MHLNAVLATALYSSAALLGQVHADDEAAESSSTSVTESSATVPVEKPTFTVRGQPLTDNSSWLVRSSVYGISANHAIAIQCQSTLL